MLKKTNKIFVHIRFLHTHILSLLNNKFKYVYLNLFSSSMVSD